MPSLNRIAAESVVFDRHFGEDFSPEAEGLAWWSGCYHYPRAGTGLVSQLPSVPDLLAEGNIDARWFTDEASTWAPLPPNAPVTVLDSFESIIWQGSQVLEEFSREGRQLLWLKVGPSLWEESPLEAWDSPETGLALARIDQTLEPLWTTIRRLGENRDVLFVISAARGMSLGDREPPAPWTEEFVHLPLIVYHSNSIGGERRSELTQSIDLPVTLLDFFAQKAPDACEGQSFLPILRGEAVEWRNVVTYGERGVWEALRTENYHFVRQRSSADSEEPRHLLFIKPDDLWDWHDVSAQEQQLTETLSGQLDAFLAAAKSGLPVAPRLAEPAESADSP